MTSSVKSKNNSAKGILNLLEFSHIISTYAIEYGIAVAKSTVHHGVSKQGCSLHTEELRMRLRFLKW